MRREKLRNENYDFPIGKCTIIQYILKYEKLAKYSLNPKICSTM